jgi:hypothetical protein
MTAPVFNSVNTRTGDIADRPSKFWASLAVADEHLRSDDELAAACARLVQENASLRCRLDELEDEMAQAVEDWGANDEMMLADNARLAAERDRLEDELVGAREALEIWKTRAFAKATVQS